MAGDPRALAVAMRIVGLDLSLTSTGWAVADGGITTGRIEPGDKCRSHARMDYIVRAVSEVAGNPVLVVIEAPLAHAPGRGDSKIEQHGLSWLVRHALWSWSKPYAMVIPTCLKKYATGKGSGKDADKFAMVQIAMRRFPGVLFTGSDEADALWLAAMGADHLGQPLVDMPKLNRQALDAVIWPEVPRA